MADQFVELALQHRVVGYLGARRHRDQHEGDALMPSGVRFEEAFITEQALEYSLRIVQAIDAENYDWAAHRMANPLRARLHMGTRGDFGEKVSRDSKGKGSYADLAPVDGDFAVVTVDREAGDVLAAVEKVTRVAFCMEANQVATKHPREKLVAPWKYAEQLLRREWHVPENPDRNVVAALTHHPRHEPQVEILHPEDVARLRLMCSDFCEDAIHAFVAVPMLCAEMAVRRHEVHQGP